MSQAASSPTRDEAPAGGRVRSLDLSAAGVARHWKSQGVGALIAAMERCEPWAVDANPQSREKAELVIADVARRFNGASPEGVSSSVSLEPALVIDFMGYLRTGRALALFGWLTEVHPSIPQLLVNEARYAADDFGSILVERITTLEKQHLLSRVFSPERIALVLELLAEAGLDSSG